MALALACGVASCGSKDKENPTPKTKAEMLAAHDWILSGLVVTYTNPITQKKETVDAFAPGGNVFIEDCEKDDYLHFINSGTTKTYALNENTNVCSPPGNDKGTWSMNADQTKLTITPDGETAEEADIKELTDSSLKLTSADGLLGLPFEVELSFRVK